MKWLVSGIRSRAQNYFPGKVFLQSIIFLLCLSGSLSSQLIRPVLDDSLFSTYYNQRATHFKSLPPTKNEIIFLGNSISDGAEWSELFGDLRIKNRGISGDRSDGVIPRINEITERKPAKVFLLIGTNDLARNMSTDSLVKNILWIAAYLRQETPATQLYVQSILPVNDVFNKFQGHTNKSVRINEVNAILKENAGLYKYTYIDLHTPFSNSDGKLDTSYTNDGLHLTGKGYLLWKHLLYPYVFNFQSKPSIIPLPRQLEWNSGYFPLYACKKIIVKDEVLKKEAERLQKKLSNLGLQLSVTEEAGSDEPFIELRLDNLKTLQLSDEAYTLEVTGPKIVLSANTSHGIFNGIQTLQQLMIDRVMIDACKIADWPSFSWRGYMVDVGRNYQSIDMIKEQIDIMAAYKLNIFHFHLTEDIAWRLETPTYPQLTAPENMLRNKGSYYSVEELKELIRYCRERYITLVPEIDMPGHSDAFTRAMGVDMQSEEGLKIVKDILTDFCNTYDIPYLHIGADEVKITNKEFIPQVTALVHLLGKQTIGWDPGGNLENLTIRQLWMSDGATRKDLRYIDSRHLYLNHMDPLESVTTIFSRRIADKDSGNSNILGGTICLWNDRNVLNPEDVLRMNPVYPAMLAFAERIWNGGGYNGWITNNKIAQTAQLKAFSAFEKRLSDHQQNYFKELPFPYVKQADIKWKLFGPYDNKGDITRSFEPEQKSFTIKNEKLEVAGGTVILRHFWHPLVKGVLDEPKENTTWYATTQIWSDMDTLGFFWIGFNNLSRSYNSHTPDKGTWDNKGSKVFFNERLISPPDWARPGQKGHSEIPLTDEGYEYRNPVVIPVQKGWNKVLIKLPAGSFKGQDWQNPVKWMFTFVRV